MYQGFDRILLDASLQNTLGISVPQLGQNWNVVELTNDGVLQVEVGT